MTNHRRLTPKINGVRIKGIGVDGQENPSNGVVSAPGEREEISYEPHHDPAWLEADLKIAEWYHSTAKKAKGTALNYSRLLYLCWRNNKQFRGFKTTGQWLIEVDE